MKVSNDYDRQVAEMLIAQFHEVIAAADTENPDITQNEIISALLHSLGEVLVNISCPECRHINKETIEQLLPTILREAMKEAAQHPQSSGHIH